MANIKLIKRRIKSVQNISQITRAMEMVAASKMKQAQEEAQASKPYTQKIYQAVSDLRAHASSDAHVLLSTGNPQGNILVILISTNKGLCGGLNTNLFRELSAFTRRQKNKVDFVSVGKKGEAFVVRHRSNLVADFSRNVPFTQSISSVNKFAVDGFTTGVYKEVYVAFNNFVSALRHEPTIKRILPITSIEHGFDSQTPIETKSSFGGEFLFEPTRSEILSSLLPHYLENQIRAAILEGSASEHSARMIAMKNATDAALDLVDGLILTYNKARQEKITSEIADIVTAREAVQ